VELVGHARENGPSRLQQLDGCQRLRQVEVGGVDALKRGDNRVTAGDLRTAARGPTSTNSASIISTSIVCARRYSIVSGGMALTSLRYEMRPLCQEQRLF